MSSQEIKKDMKKDPLSNKAPEKPMLDVASGNALLSSETILRTNKRGMAKSGGNLSPCTWVHLEPLVCMMSN